MKSEDEIEKNIFDLLKINSPLLSEGKKFFYNLQQLTKKGYFCAEDIINTEKYNSEKYSTNNSIIFQKYSVNTCNLKNNIKNKLNTYNTNFVLEVENFRKYLHDIDPLIINRIKIKCNTTCFFEENWKIIEIPGCIYLENEYSDTSIDIIHMFNYIVNNTESIIILVGDICRIVKYCELYFLQYIPDSYQQYKGDLKYSDYCKIIISKLIIVVSKIENFTRSDILHIADPLFHNNVDPAAQNDDFSLTYGDLISLRWTKIHRIVDSTISNLIISSLYNHYYWHSIARINHNIPIRYIGTDNNDNYILTELYNDIKKLFKVY